METLPEPLRAATEENDIVHNHDALDKELGAVSQGNASHGTLHTNDPPAAPQARPQLEGVSDLVQDRIQQEPCRAADAAVPQTVEGKSARWAAVCGFPIKESNPRIGPCPGVPPQVEDP